ncbi:MAG: hypothetical protein COA33_001080 [Fluviicola sp.]|nr:hypothetical protein [Fluviicola sp.]
MGLGAGAVAAMQKTYNQNRALAKGSKRTLKDIPTSGRSNSEAKPLVYNEFTKEEYEQFKIELAAKRKKERIKSVAIFVISALIILSLYFYRRS